MRPKIVWITTDTHFYHDNIIEYCNRPKNYNEKIIKNLRHYLASQDILIHLGDVIFYQYNTLKSILDSIKGTKVLVQGNHDRKTKTWYMNNGFNFVADAIQLDKFIFTHQPIYPIPEGLINVHGHWHNIEIKKPEWYSDRHKLIKLEHHYKPIQMSNL